MTRLAIDELAETIAGIFEHTGWVHGGYDGSWPHVPSEQEIAELLSTLTAKARTDSERRPGAALVSNGRLMVIAGSPAPYDEHIRVLLDIGEIPLRGSGA